MIVSRHRKFIFVHVPKAAGTSISQAYTPLALWDDLVLGGSQYGRRIRRVYEKKFPLSTHSTANQIRTVVGQAVWEESFKFAFVRDPVDRVVSFYAYLEHQYLRRGLRRHIDRHRNKLQEPWRWKGMQLFLNTRSFTEFVHHPEFAGHFMPQTHFVCKPEGGDTLVDYVGRMENLSHDWAHIRTRMGVPDLELPVRNTSGSLRPKPVPSASDVAHIREIMAADHDRFGY